MTGLVPAALLKGSQSMWLRERATRYDFARRSVSRFVPGERFEDALTAARRLHAHGTSAMFTHLGENLSRPGEAVAHHYLGVLDCVVLWASAHRFPSSRHSSDSISGQSCALRT